MLNFKRKSLFHRGISLLLVLIMVVAAMPLHAHAAGVPSDAATFLVGNPMAGTTTYRYLDQAIEAAKGITVGLKQITVIESGKAYHSGGGTSFDIPAGVDLVVPCDSDGGLYDDPTFSVKARQLRQSEEAPGTSQKVYKKLILDGTQINCSGRICVDGYFYAKAGHYSGVPTGAYGQIELTNSSSKINMNNGGYQNGELYCYGYITGAGEVVINNGAKLYENYQLLGWQGGTLTKAWGMMAEALISDGKPMGTRSANSFAYNEYAIQNVEAKLTVKYGAQANVMALITAGSGTEKASDGMSIPYAGASGFVQLKSGNASLQRSYDPVNNRMTYTFGGNVELGGIDMTMQLSTIAQMGLGCDALALNSVNYIFAIPSNMNYVAANGSTVTMGGKYKLMPGASFTVEEGAELCVNKELYIYDTSDYVGKNYLSSNSSLRYVASTDQKLLPAITSATPDAKLTVNGTLRINGAVYTTTGGSSAEKALQGTGKIINNSSANAVVTNVLDEFTAPTSSTVSRQLVAVAPIAGRLAGISTSADSDSIYFGKSTYYGLGNEHNDYWYETAETVASTCTEAEYKLYTCANAAESYMAYTGAPKLAHMESPIVDEADANCAVEGYTKHTCRFCGVTETVTKQKLWHQYDAETGKCIVCGGDMVRVNFDPALKQNGVYNAANGTFNANEQGWYQAIEIPADAEAVYFKTYEGSETYGSVFMNGSEFISGVSAQADNWVRVEIPEGADTLYYCQSNASTVEYLEFATSHTHDYQAVVTAPSCTEKGYTTYTCVCRDSYVGDEVAALGHKAGEEVTENEVNATCTTAGKYDLATYCTVCGTQTSRNTVTLPATGHNFGEPTFSWNAAAYAATCNAIFPCSKCNGNIPMACQISANRTNPTCEANGSVIYTATVTVNGKTYTDVTDKMVAGSALGHTMDAATGKCKSCGKDLAVAEVTINGGTPTKYSTMAEAFAAALTGTDTAPATMKLLWDVDLGTDYLNVNTGAKKYNCKFTIDLNGHELSSAIDSTTGNKAIIHINGATKYTTVVNVVDSAGGGKIVNTEIGANSRGEVLSVYNGTVNLTDVDVIGTVNVMGNSLVTINGGSVTRDISNKKAVSGNAGSITLNNVTVSGQVGCNNANSVVTINGGSITSSSTYAVNVSAGSISLSNVALVGNYIMSNAPTDIYFYGTYTAKLNEGVSFPGGAAVYGTTLNAILGDDMGYWQGANMINVGDNKIVDGDIEVKEACQHEKGFNDVVTAPTCTKDGYTSNICIDCSFTNSVTPIPATGHTAGAAVEENRSESTCTEAGSYESVVYCSVCSAELSRETTTVPASGHTEVTVDGKPATCTESGLTDGIKCSVCGETIKAQEEIPALEHTYTATETKAPTCTEKGVMTYTCACGDTYTEEIAAKGHNPGEPVEENRTEPDCVNDGGYDTVTYCTVCNTEIARANTSIHALGHTYGEPEFDWYATIDEANCNVTFTCSKCDDGTFWKEGNISENRIPATSEAEGSVTYTAKVSNEGEEYTDTKTVVIPKLESAVKYGDLDGDTEITINDALIVQRYIAKLTTEIDGVVADVDGDGEITVNDALLIQRYVAKLISAFPVA